MLIIIRDINSESMDVFAQSINNLEKWDKLEVYVDSNWWSTIDTYLMLDILNWMENVKMYGGRMISSWYLLFKEFKGERVLLSWAFGGTHYTGRECNLWDEWKPRGAYDRFIMEEQKRQKEPDISYMTEKEKEIYRSWEMIYFWEERLREIFKL